MASSTRAGRSVVDFENLDELRKALEERIEPAGFGYEQPPPELSDWKLPVPDPEAKPQSVDHELRRLWTLKSYLLLDAKNEETLERLTQEARKIYNVPASFISLIDLGRQFLFAGVENDGIRETSRTSAFCSHTILSKNELCVVPDTHQDRRFKQNPLVTGGPKLRFYAAAPLIAPEGYKIGTFCVEGPEPRPEGLTEAEQDTLKTLAAQAMAIIVERRKKMQEAHSRSNMPDSEHLRRHAAVATNLGSILFKEFFHETILAMALLQESVQTLMHVDEGSTEAKLPSVERQRAMSELLDKCEGQSAPSELVANVRALFPPAPTDAPTIEVARGIPGMFSIVSRFQQATPQDLFFCEPFDVSMQVVAVDPTDPLSSLDDRSFIIPLQQCSKATLFNMGLVHYYWGSAETAMHFFDLAASLSQPDEATNFDPVILGCLNNMAQIHLQYGRSQDALELLTDALTRGNAALHCIYERSDGDGDDVRRTRRLRRKLARTVLNIGHVHYVRSNYDDALRSCNDAIMLLHTNMDEIEVSAVWFNMSLIYYHKDEKDKALEKIDCFLKSPHTPKGAHLAHAHHRKGKILYDLNRLDDAIVELNEALELRRQLLGEKHPQVAETLYLVGKIFQSRDELDEALDVFRQGYAIHQGTHRDSSSTSLEATHTLLEIARIHHMKNDLVEALQVYEQVKDATTVLFGEEHPFVVKLSQTVDEIRCKMGSSSTPMEGITVGS